MRRTCCMTHSAPLDSRDAGLASEIVFGVLRYRAQLDYLIEHYSGRRAEARSRGAHRAAHGHLPASLPGAHSGARRRHGERRTGEAGTQDLRRGLRQCGAAQGQSRSRGVAHARNRAVLPGVAAGALGSAITAPDAAVEIARAALREPEKYIRISPAGDRMQDIGSQSIVPLLALAAGAVASSISARRPGNKTAQALEAGVRGDRLRPPPPPPRAAEAARRRPGGPRRHAARCPSPARFDRILVDAPCSGTGTLGRNPEIKWRLTPGRSRRPARAASRRCSPTRCAVLAPGGLLVYSTCSLEPEENEGVVAVPRTLPGSMRRFPGAMPGTVSTPL